MTMNFDILQPEPYRVVKKKRETEDCFTLEVQPLEKKKVPFVPGQCNMLYVFGIGEVPISVSGDSLSDSGFVHTVKVVGKVSEALSRLEVGDDVGVRGPFGTSWPTESVKGKNLILVAGGIGLAPLRSLIYFILNNRSDFGMVTLLYGARDQNDLLYSEELKKWAEESDCQILVTVDRGDDSWTGNVGLVTSLLPQVSFDLDDAVAYVCGPEVMMRATIQELLGKGMAVNDIYLSMERNMKCAIGHCGRCQFVSNFVCKDGPVFPYSKVQPFFDLKEV